MKRFSHTLIAMAALLVMSTAAAVAQAPRIEYLDVVSSGFSGPGEVIQPSRIRRLFSRTPAVNAQKGTGFGMTVRPVGEPKGAAITLTWVWRAPRPGVMNMQTGKYVRRIAEDVPAKIGEEVQRSYVFKESNDMVLGDWRAEVWTGRRKLAVRRFAIR
jgi:hypothetical protein